MADNKIVLERLIELGKVDAAIARLIAERKTVETRLAEAATKIAKQKKQFLDIQSAHDTKKSSTEQIDRRLKDERSKLVDRRKSLASFSNYKLQQAAAREIEASSKQLSDQESSLVEQYDDIEKLSEQVSTLESELKGAEEEFASQENDAKETLSGIEERMAEKTATREELLGEVDKKLLTEYQRVQNRHPNDPIVKVEGANCSGCFMQIPPQFINRLGRGTELVRCRGCGRILYMEREELEAAGSDT